MITSKIKIQRQLIIMSVIRYRKKEPFHIKAIFLLYVFHQYSNSDKPYNFLSRFKHHCTKFHR